ncbi:hypothetical protein T492DRAFT_987339 [Pavlovales sp. CCMP2436]|nr:hypothetical protein T492DRAFT_987339 [Pavlovales sp. CCMP2436]
MNKQTKRSTEGKPSKKARQRANAAERANAADARLVLPRSWPPQQPVVAISKASKTNTKASRRIERGLAVARDPHTHTAPVRTRRPHPSYPPCSPTARARLRANPPVDQSAQEPCDQGCDASETDSEPDSPPFKLPDSPPFELPDSPPFELPDSPPFELAQEPFRGGEPVAGAEQEHEAPQWPWEQNWPCPNAGVIAGSAAEVVVAEYRPSATALAVLQLRAHQKITGGPAAAQRPMSVREHSFALPPPKSAASERPTEQLAAALPLGSKRPAAYPPLPPQRTAHEVAIQAAGAGYGRQGRVLINVEGENIMLLGLTQLELALFLALSHPAASLQLSQAR